MNIYLLELLGRWIAFLFVSLISFFGNFSLKENVINTNNDINNKSLSIINTVIPYETITNIKSNIPRNVKRVITEGQDGIVLKNDNGEIISVYQEVINKVVETGKAEIGSYVGRMTGYGPDCKTCSGVGTVACRNADRKNHNLINDGIYYDDKDYGKVRILSATKELFACGTIIEVKRNNETFIGVVMDRGSAMENAWKNKSQVLIDLAFETEQNPEIFKATSSNVEYNVKRWGW